MFTYVSHWRCVQMLLKQVLQLRMTELALCNKLCPTYVVLRVVAYVYAQLTQHTFVVVFSKRVECIYVAHKKYIKSIGQLFCAHLMTKFLLTYPN